MMKRVCRRWLVRMCIGLLVGLMSVMGIEHATYAKEQDPVQGCGLAWQGEWMAAASVGYRLPWPCRQRYRVTQGWNGAYSHSGTMKYAYDFAMPEGTPIRASQSGRVAFVQKGKIECGGIEAKDDGNYVVIDHSDGAATLYLHLKDVYVWPGQYVSRGQTIGTSGKTGWTECNPHLHFQRQEQGAWFRQSIKVYFDEYPNQVLQPWHWYTSLNGAPGEFCPVPMDEREPVTS